MEWDHPFTNGHEEMKYKRKIEKNIITYSQHHIWGASTEICHEVNIQSVVTTFTIMPRIYVLRIVFRRSKMRGNISRYIAQSKRKSEWVVGLIQDIYLIFEGFILCRRRKRMISMSSRRVKPLLFLPATYLGSNTNDHGIEYSVSESLTVMVSISCWVAATTRRCVSMTTSSSADLSKAFSNSSRRIRSAMARSSSEGSAPQPIRSCPGPASSATLDTARRDHAARPSTEVEKRIVEEVQVPTQIHEQELDKRSLESLPVWSSDCKRCIFSRAMASHLYFSKYDDILQNTDIIIPSFQETLETMTRLVDKVEREATSNSTSIDSVWRKKQK